MPFRPFDEIIEACDDIHEEVERMVHEERARVRAGGALRGAHEQVAV
jgi:hypothetical protein